MRLSAGWSAASAHYNTGGLTVLTEDATGPRADRLRGRNLLDELFRIRDAQREQQKTAIWLVKGTEVPWEVNQQGKMRWYLHPSIDDVCLRTHLLYVQEI